MNSTRSHTRRTGRGGGAVGTSAGRSISRSSPTHPSKKQRVHTSDTSTTSESSESESDNSQLYDSDSDPDTDEDEDDEPPTNTATSTRQPSNAPHRARQTSAAQNEDTIDDAILPTSENYETISESWTDAYIKKLLNGRKDLGNRPPPDVLLEAQAAQNRYGRTKELLSLAGGTSLRTLENAL